MAACRCESRVSVGCDTEKISGEYGEPALQGVYCGDNNIDAISIGEKNTDCFAYQGGSESPFEKNIYSTGARLLEKFGRPSPDVRIGCRGGTQRISYGYFRQFRVKGTKFVSGEWPGRAVADTARILVDADVTGGISKFFVEEASGKGGGTNFLGRLTPSENEEILSSAATRLVRFGTHKARSILDDAKLFILSMYADKKYADEKVMESLGSIGRGKVEGARHWVETKKAFSTRELTSFAEVMGKTQFPPLARPTRTGRNTALDAEGFFSKLRRHLEENRNAESVEAHVRLTSGCLSRFVTENAKTGYMEEYVSAIVSAVTSVSEEAPPDGDEIPAL